MNSDRYLVTGAMGCLGSWVIRRLLDDGSDVIAFDLATDGHRLELLATREKLARVTFTRGDITDLGAIRNVIASKQISHIIHCAALQIPFVRGNPSRGAQVNVTGTVNVFEAAAAHAGQIRGLVYASAAGVFGPPTMYPEGFVRDDSPRNPSTLYGVFKQANEDTARVYWAEQSISSVGLRPWIIYGPGRDQGMTSDVTTAMLAVASGVPYQIGFGGESLFQFAPDVASAFVTAARAEHNGAAAFNLGGETATVQSVVEILEEIDPTCRGRITYDPTPLPVIARADTSGFEATVTTTPITSLPDGTRQTVAMFRRLLDRGLLKFPQ